MNIHVKALSKKIPAFLIKRSDNGNLILCAGACAVLIALTLPAFLKIYSSSTTYISAAEYIHARIVTGTGSLFIVIAFGFCICIALAALISGPHRILSGTAALAIIMLVAALVLMHIPFGQIGAGIYVMAAGLAAIGAGIVRI